MNAALYDQNWAKSRKLACTHLARSGYESPFGLARGFRINDDKTKGTYQTLTGGVAEKATGWPDSSKHLGDNGAVREQCGAFHP
jgi:hypothetical protein